MEDKDPDRIAFKFKVIQEYEVVLYYEKGVIADNEEDAQDYVLDDVLDLAYNQEGLVCKTDEESDSCNGYVAFVTSFDPKVEEIYNTKELPKKIENELKRRKILK